MVDSLTIQGPKAEFGNVVAYDASMETVCANVGMNPLAKVSPDVTFSQMGASIQIKLDAVVGKNPRSIDTGTQGIGEQARDMSQIIEQTMSSGDSILTECMGATAQLANDIAEVKQGIEIPSDAPALEVQITGHQHPDQAPPINHFNKDFTPAPSMMG
jgi:hypothetical protein